MKFRQQHTQAVSAAKSGFSERSARRVEKNPNPMPTVRKWRTRQDPFKPVWDSILAPMLREEPTLTGLTLWEYLDDNYPDQYPYALLRTLQRRVKHFRHTEGPSPEVIFRQDMPMGIQGLSDFTHPDTAITIAGEPFKHLIYQFRLAFSGWRYAMVVQGGESYAALSEGLQNALSLIGGSPKEHRTDSLSAAYNNHHDKQDFTEQYSKLCEHYTMKPTRNNLGVSHENGAIEQAHRALKHRLNQAIKLRKSHDFDSVEAYQAFINKEVEKLNRRTTSKIAQEQAVLQSLPQDRYMDYSHETVKVTTSSTISVKRTLYSVPSTLIGTAVNVHVHHDRLIGYLGMSQVFELERVYPNSRTERARSIDWRHVINSLVCKPQAFRYSQFRDDLLPDDNYKAIWSIVDAKLMPNDACKWIVTTLKIAADHQDWRVFGQQLRQEVETYIPSLVDMQNRYVPNQKTDHIRTNQHDLAHYDRFIPTGGA